MGMTESRLKRDLRWKKEQVLNWWNTHPSRGRIRHYFPCIWFLLGAWILSSFPALAAFLLVTFLLSLGFLYAFFVHQFHKAEDRMRHSQEGYPGFQDDPFYSNFGGSEPTFRNVTVYMTRRGFKDF
jgi:hypothetical protein